MSEAENHVLPGATTDTWRTWLMTGARHRPVDRRRMRGDHVGLKRLLVEGMTDTKDRPHAWNDFSGAMIRHAIDEAMRSLPSQDTHVVKLAYFGGYSNREIAEQVGLTEATVQRRLKRALASISEHIQHGRTLARRAMYALMVWMSGRWLSDSAHHVVQAAAVVATAAIVVSQPAPGSLARSPDGYSPQTTTTPAAPSTNVVLPVPSPSVPLISVPSAPQLQLPPVQLPPVQLPPVNLPLSLPTPTLPTPTPLPTINIELPV